MTRSLHTLDIRLSRRGVLGGAALAVGVGALAISAQAEPVKRSQKVVSYQDTPKGRARCDNCSQWQPPEACKTVAGVIKPSGWCSVYAPKL